MPRSRNGWWSHAKSIIKEFPALQREHDAVLDPRVTARPSGSSGGKSGGTPNSQVELCVIHDLPKAKQKKYDAVMFAIEQTRARHPSDYKPRMKVIDLVYWRRTHTIEGAALNIPCSKNTAAAWQAEFVKLVGESMEFF